MCSTSLRSLSSISACDDGCLLMSCDDGCLLVSCDDGCLLMSCDDGCLSFDDGCHLTSYGDDGCVSVMIGVEVESSAVESQSN